MDKFLIGSFIINAIIIILIIYLFIDINNSKKIKYDEFADYEKLYTYKNLSSMSQEEFNEQIYTSDNYISYGSKANKINMNIELADSESDMSIEFFSPPDTPQGTTIQYDQDYNSGTLDAELILLGTNKNNAKFSDFEKISSSNFYIQFITTSDKYGPSYNYYVSSVPFKNLSDDKFPQSTNLNIKIEYAKNKYRTFILCLDIKFPPGDKAESKINKYAIFNFYMSNFITKYY